MTGRPVFDKPTGLFVVTSSTSGSQPSQSVQVAKFFPLTYTLMASNFTFLISFVKLYERDTSCSLMKLLFCHMLGSILAREPEILRGYLPEGLAGDQ